MIDGAGCERLFDGFGLRAFEVLTGPPVVARAALIPLIPPPRAIPLAASGFALSLVVEGWRCAARTQRLAGQDKAAVPALRHKIVGWRSFRRRR